MQCEILGLFLEEFSQLDVGGHVFPRRSSSCNSWWGANTLAEKHDMNKTTHSKHVANTCCWNLVNYGNYYHEVSLNLKCWVVQKQWKKLSLPWHHQKHFNCKGHSYIFIHVPKVSCFPFARMCKSTLKSFFSRLPEDDAAKKPNPAKEQKKQDWDWVPHEATTTRTSRTTHHGSRYWRQHDKRDIISAQHATCSCMLTYIYICGCRIVRDCRKLAPHPVESYLKNSFGLTWSDRIRYHDSLDTEGFHYIHPLGPLGPGR